MENKEIPLPVLNLCAKGKSLKESWKIYNGSKDGKDHKAGEKASKEEPKLSAKEKKESLAIEFESMGLTPPDKTESVAKWHQLLCAAKDSQDDFM